MESVNERLKNLIAQMTIRPGNENISYNYFGYIFSRIGRVSDDSLPSIMGIVPRKNGTLALAYNQSYFDGTSDEVLRKVIEHEGMHVLNKHIPRLLRVIANEPNDKLKYAKSRIWNTAADCAANPAIDMPRTCLINNKPWESCFPDLYEMEDNLPTETYYQILLNRAQEKEKQGKSGDMEAGGAGVDYDIIGDHSKWGDVAKEVADVSSLSRKIDGHIQEIIKDSVKNFKHRRGMLPGHIKDLIDAALSPPQVPYYQLIRKLIKGSRHSKFKSSLTRMNKKRAYSFIIGKNGVPLILPFPGKTRDFSFKIVILIDTSGSMSNKDIQEALSGCKNIIEKDRHCVVTVLENDAHLNKEYKVKKIKDIQFDISGRGGTHLQEGLYRAAEINPDVVLAFTDGECENVNNYPRNELPKRIIWVVRKNGDISTLNKTGFIVRVNNG